MVRLFKRGVHRQLQDQLFDLIDTARLIAIPSLEGYDAWLDAIIVDDRWEYFSRNGLAADRYGYFAKLVNIIVYEVASNRELLADADWQRLKMWLHVPLDSMVFAAIQSVLPSFPIPATLKGMKADEYWIIQKALRQLARKLEIPPVWFDDAWSP
jgi:hypothetical protein